MTADQEARRAVAEDLDATLFVEAGAGSGKTTALVSRIVGLVTTGKARLGDIAAITFTEAAAGELKGRLRAELKIVLQDTPANTSVWDRLSTALAELDSSAVTTLHGFARRLLAEHPFDAGLPPGFVVSDEVDGAIRRQARRRAILDRILDSPDNELLIGVASIIGVGPAQIETLVADLEGDWDRVAEWWTAEETTTERKPFDGTFDPTAFIEELRRAVSLAEHCSNDDDKLRCHLDALSAHLARIVLAAERAGPGGGDGRDRRNLLRAILRCPKLSPSKGRAANWPKEVLEEVRTSLKGATSALDATLATLGAAVAHELVAQVAPLVLQGAHDRLRGGNLEFHDLLVAARDLLRNDATRASLAKRFRFLLIDEFQDTDPLQLEIASLLATPPEGSAPSPGRLFFVGDPKQAIYRFRRADIALFFSARDTVGAKTLSLVSNFRSVAPVLDWVNAVFGDLIGTGNQGQAAFEPLVPTRAPLGGTAAFDPGPCVSYLDGVAGSAGELRELEAAEVSACISQILEQGWLVEAPGAGVRPVKPSDIAVLIPTRGPLDSLERAMQRAGVAYSVEAASLAWSSGEVRELLVTLEAVDNPGDEIAVVAALRSPLVGCSDTELVQHRLGGGSWDPLAQIGPGAGGRVAHALATIGDWHSRAWALGAAEAVSMVITEGFSMESSAFRSSPGDAWRRLGMVEDLARRIEAEGGGLRDLLRLAKAQIDSAARSMERPVGSPRPDAVRVLTVHGAKGLEFPVVILAGLGAGIKSTSQPVLWDQHGRPEVRLRDGVETSGHADLAGAESTADQHERVRLAYVAATRARDHLVVSCWRTAKPSLATSILAASAPYPHLWRPFELGPARRESPSTHGSRANARPDSSDQDWLVTERAHAIAGAEVAGAARQRRSVAATEVVALASASLPPAWDREWSARSADEKGPGTHQSGHAASAIGTAVHAVLEALDLSSDGAAATELARYACTTQGIEEAASDVASLARSALRAKVVREAAGLSHWKETFVAAPIGSVVLEGFIDLLVEGPDGLWVVDYKTDSLRAGDAPAHALRYRLQAAAYALAVQEVLALPVTRAVLVFLSPSRSVEHDIADLAEATDEVRRLVLGLGPQPS